MVNKWLKIVQHGLGVCLSLPCHCLFCMQPSQRDFALCQACEARVLPWLGGALCCYCAIPIKGFEAQGYCGQCAYRAPAYERLQVLFDYRWPVNIFIGQLKYGKKLHFSKLLGRLLARHLTPITPVECIIPLPLHPKRQQERGFNQALEIARYVAKDLALPLNPWHCTRKRYRPAQTALSAKARMANISDSSFSIAPQFQAKHVLVIDDVVTTGTTIEAFASALKQAGVITVEVWACCRTVIHADSFHFTQ